MSALQKATLVEISPDEKATPVGSPVPVVIAGAGAPVAATVYE